MKKIIGVLAVGLWAALWPSAAGAQSAAEALTLKAYFGANCLDGGEFNSGQKGWAEFYEIIFGLLSYAAGSEVRPAEFGLTGGGEVFYRIGRSLRAGLGVGVIQSSQKSDIAFTPAAAGREPLTYTAETRMIAVPVTVNLYYFLPAKGRLAFGVHAGLGPHPAWGYASQRLSETSGDWTLNEFKVQGGGLGFQGGLGLEYVLSRGLAFTLEARGRYAVFSNFKGDVVKSDSSGWTSSVGGLLWNERLDLGALGSVDILDVSETKPSGSVMSDVRRTRVDFSGVSLILGVVFRI
ncbi:MAG: hypothetical protein FJY83_05630 [Candidatus Aminicenantes bacterium]|nr:hypothetical protein [Candidatus Aminicenantes bacterium]